MQRYPLHSILKGATSLAIAAQVLVAPQASAATVTDTATYSNASTDTLSQLLEVDLFDPTLGTLNKVSVSFTGDLSTDGVVNNTATRPFNTVAIQVKGSFTATRSDGAPAALAPTVNLFAPNSNIGSATIFTILGAGPHDFGPVAKSSVPAVQTLDFTAAGDMQGFVGNGVFGYRFATAVFATPSTAASFLTFQMTTLSNATLTVTYDYTPDTVPVSSVPLPATPWLLASGLLGLSGIAARRRKRSGGAQG